MVFLYKIVLREIMYNYCYNYVFMKIIINIDFGNIEYMKLLMRCIFIIPEIVVRYYTNNCIKLNIWNIGIKIYD